MHRSNNAVIMQTEQLGRIEALEEELRSSRGKVADLEQKMMEQDRCRVRWLKLVVSIRKLHRWFACRYKQAG